MKQKSLKLNAALNVLRTIMSLIFPIITFPYASRILLPEGIGKVNFVNSIVSYFSMLAMLGIGTYGTREAAKLRNDKEGLNQFCSEVFTINLLSTIVAYVFFFIISFCIPFLRNYRTLLLLASITILFTTIGIGWFYGGIEEYAYITIRTVLFQIISIALLFIFVKTEKDVVYYLLIGIVSSVGSNLLNLIHARKFIKLSITKPNISKHFKPICLLFGITVISSIYNMLDTTMLGFLSNDEQVGFYTAATKINKMVLMLVTSVSAVIFPRLSYYANNNETKEFNNLVSKSFSFLLCISIPATIGLNLLSNQIMLLFSGENFIPAIPVMKLMNPIIIIISISSFIGSQIFIPLKKEKTTIRAVSLGAAINFILNLILIRKYNAYGAAIATLTAESAVLIHQFIFARQYFSIKKEIKNILQYCFATALMALAVKGLLLLIQSTTLGLIISIITGVIVYAGTLLLLRNTFIISILKNSKIYSFYKKYHKNTLNEKKAFRKLYREANKIINNSQKIGNNNSLIVSLTSYPERIKSAAIVIASIFNQSVKPDKIVLTLSSLQFPKHKLPKLIKKEIKNGLEIIWTDDDLRSHKKYFYVMQQYPQSIIITVDDDNLYDKTLIETLLNAHKAFPDTIICTYAHEIKENENSIAPYSTWTEEVPVNIPSTMFTAIGVGGVLYPSGIMNPLLFNKQDIIELCPFADDLWLKTMQLLAQTPVKVVKVGDFSQNVIPCSQNNSLYVSNLYEGRNDEQLKNIMNKYNDFNGNDASILNIILNDKDLVYPAEKRMKKYGFVILHYLSFEMTDICIKRILNLFLQYDIEIVCVDNNSNNDSLQRLKQKYDTYSNINFIKNEENLGFARGNNAGYTYLKNNFNCDYILVINNDLLFLDSDTLDNIDMIYNMSHFGVLGPDIYNPKAGTHQNPAYYYNVARLYGRTIEDVVKRNKELKTQNDNFLYFTIKDKLLKMRHKYFFWLRKFIPNKNPQQEDKKLESFDKELENVVLHGACYIFSKDFIKKRELAFNPETFLYFEEDILHLECKHQNIKMLYSPLIKVEHLEDVSTNIAFRRKYKREKMITKNLLHSTNVFIKLYNEYNKN